MEGILILAVFCLCIYCFLYKFEIDKLKKDIDNQKLEIDAKQKEILSLHASYQTLNNKLKEEQSKKIKFEYELDALFNKLRIKEHELKLSKGNVNALQHELKISKKEEENLQKELLVSKRENINMQLQLLTFRKQAENLQQEKEKLNDSLKVARNAFLKKEKETEDYIANRQIELDVFLSGQKEIMPYIAGMIADYMTLEYDVAAETLLNKTRSAPKEAQRIQDLKIKHRQELAELKVYEYNLKYLIKLYPELDDVLDAEYSDVISIDYTEHDPVRDWLSPEEWHSLQETKKNQIALDRYVARRKKSNWQIGRDYELYVGQHYERLGYSVEYYGMDKKIEDLGRDLIAKKDNKTLVIQCKCWSKHKQIHENTITQLFGTLTAYRVEQEESLFNVIEGVLVTTIELSETAKKFAKLLNITVIENMPMQEFPRIKCNIGKNGEKIYHLPMDQQYDNVKIDKPGECYAYTVDEAEQLGFRRAFRYTGRK